MKKHFVGALFFCVLAFAAVVSARADGPEPRVFQIVNTYTSGQFEDVAPHAWYAMNVQASYEYGLAGGRSTGVFAPEDSLTLSEAVAMAARLGSIYHTGRAAPPSDGVWYAPYADYATQKGIIGPGPHAFDTYVTRAEFAGMIARALPPSALGAINSVADNAIPDVPVSDPWGGAVYTLYRAGIATGRGQSGAFAPRAALTRAEAAAIVCRAADPQFRKKITLPAALGAEDIYEKCAPAVFYIERYNTEGDLTGIGSGFFIAGDGLAVTNYHVIENAAFALATLADGRTYDITGICGYDKEADIALLRIDGGPFPYLTAAGGGPLPVGSEVYAIGSPYGLMNTLSKGRVSAPLREIGGESFIQFSAPISLGSGGGPVLNGSGQVVGVTCMTVLSAQTLNFAVPIGAMDGLSATDAVPLISIIAQNFDGVYYYNGYYPAPDYGVFAGAPLYLSQVDPATGVKTYFYDVDGITADPDTAVDGYVALLRDTGFDWQRAFVNDNGYTIDVYRHPGYDMYINFGLDSLDGVVCRVVALY